MEDEREEGEIVDVIDDDIYENIISSDEVDEDDLRQRIQDLEAKNSELEKIASISKTYDYGLGCGSSNFIDLVDDGDDDESYYRQPSKYDYSSYTSSRKTSRSKRRKPCRHESKKSKRNRPYKTERRKKTQPNRTRASSDSSSDDEFLLDRDKLQAALKRNNSSNHSSSLKRKLIGVTKTVEDFIKAKEDVGDEDISASNEIMHLLNKINVNEIAPKASTEVSEEETESCLNEQELRIIALKSAILKKAEARKQRKMNETQPYSPTDDVVMESVILSKVSVIAKPKDELDNMEISPAVSPTNHADDSLQPIDMDLESDDEIAPEMANVASNDSQKSITVPVPDEMSLSTANVPEETNQPNLSFDSSQQRKQQEEEEEQALRASLLANLKTSKRKAPSIESPSMPKPLEEEDSLPVEKSTGDVSVEMDQLRKQVISSMQKRRKLNLLPNPFAQKFMVQVPIPMEMTMPQITSNLKEALKRIKERDKQNVDVDPPVASNDIGDKTNTGKLCRNMNGLTESSGKVVVVDVNESKKVQTQISELKSIAIKLSGGNVSPKTVPSDPIVISKKSCAPVSTKINDVLKNVTSNNSSVDTTKSKDATVPLVISNKIETAAIEKTDAAIRSLKAVAQKKVITEPNTSLNQKENQQLRKVVASPKRPSDEKLAIVKKTKITNVKVSRVITTPVEKPVKKMIIQLNNSDTESDDLELGQQNVAAGLNNKSYSGVASPAGCSFSPLSPANVADNKTTDKTIPTTNDNFQRKLDEYLKSARTKVEKTKQDNPSLVSHLPLTSQLEYRKLINRMALLEKQKLLKESQSKIVPVPTKPPAKPAPSSNISVTIPNDLFNHKPKSTEHIVQINGARKECQTEISVTFHNADAKVPKECSYVSHIATKVVVTDNAPEICVQLRETISTKSKEPPKLTNGLRNGSATSEPVRNKFLQQSESEYMSHSESYLVDINNMSVLVNKARQEKSKQFQIESKIEQMEARVQQLKKQLVQQKISVSKLYPVISSQHKNIMQKRSKSLQLNKKCYQVGNKIVGAEYKIPGDPKADIAEKLKSLSSETKLLRNFRKPGTISETTTTTPPAVPVSIEQKSLQTEYVNHTPVVAAAAAAPAAIPISCEKPDDAQQSSINCTPDNIPMPCSMMKYQSPLEHMKNIGVTNPDSVVCPFQLLGQCEDKECTYQHLS